MSVYLDEGEFFELLDVFQNLFGAYSWNYVAKLDEGYIYFKTAIDEVGDKNISNTASGKAAKNYCLNLRNNLDCLNGFGLSAEELGEMLKNVHEIAVSYDTEVGNSFSKASQQIVNTMYSLHGMTASEGGENPFPAPGSLQGALQGDSFLRPSDTSSINTNTVKVNTVNANSGFIEQELTVTRTPIEEDNRSLWDKFLGLFGLDSDSDDSFANENKITFGSVVQDVSEFFYGLFTPETNDVEGTIDDFLDGEVDDDIAIASIFKDLFGLDDDEEAYNSINYTFDE